MLTTGFLSIRTGRYRLRGSLLLLLMAVPLQAKILTITAAPTDSNALITDLEPLFGINWRLIRPPHRLVALAADVQFISDSSGFLSINSEAGTDPDSLWEYDRGRWISRQVTWMPHFKPFALFALSREDLWLSVQTGISLKQDLFHYDGKAWSLVRTPNSDRIRSLYMLAADDGWAGCEWGQIMHWDGRSWRLAPCPADGHVCDLIMRDDSTGMGWLKTHRKEPQFLYYSNDSWQIVTPDSISWLHALVATGSIYRVTNLLPVALLARNTWLERPAAQHDTLLLEAPLRPEQLLLGHPRGTLLRGRLARSFREPDAGWIANLVEESRSDGRHNWITIHFFNRAGEKRILTIRLPLPKNSPLPFQYHTAISAGWYGNERGIAIADFDGNGSEDIFAVATGAANHLYIRPSEKNPGQPAEAAAEMGVAGDATLPTGVTNYDEGASAADVDNDGDQDILVTSLYGKNLLFRKLANGHFRAESDEIGIGDCWARSCSAIWADVNGDGALDLYIANEDSSNRLYLNNGAGHFRDVTAAAGLRTARGGGGGPACADIDSDGDPDLFVPRYGRANLLFVNLDSRSPEGIPFFAEQGRERGVAGSDTLARSTSATWGDVDNDGDLDLLVTNQAQSNWLYLNDGRGRFQDGTAVSGLTSSDLTVTALLLDADNDGDLDLLTGNRGPNRYYQNLGGGRFEENRLAAALYRDTMTTSMASYDEFGDGDLDVYLGQAGDRSIVYGNTTNDNRWLEVKLQGDRYNRDAIGARLWLYRGGHFGDPAHLLGMREINGGSGFNSMSSRIVHFGLADERLVDLRVQFPGGAVLERRGVAPAQQLTIHELSGLKRRALQLRSWFRRLGKDPEPQRPLALFFFLLLLTAGLDIYLITMEKWPARSLWLMVVLPMLLMGVLLALLANQPPTVRYAFAIGVAIIAWSLAAGLYYSREQGRNHRMDDLEKLYLTTSAFFHGEWAARKLNRIEFYCQNLGNDRAASDEIVTAFTGAIDDFFTMIAPEVQKIIEFAQSSRLPGHLRSALEVAMFNLTQSLNELKVDLHLGERQKLSVVIQRTQILNTELQALRKHVASHFSCRIDRIVEDTLDQNRRPEVTCRLEYSSSQALWGRIPGYALSQILENLLDNAHTAIASSKRREIVVEIDANADYIFVRIMDSGPGIPPGIAARLFKERVSTKTSPGGFGLFHTHAVLTKFGGSIRLMEPEEGTGAAFEMILKRSEHE